MELILGSQSKYRKIELEKGGFVIDRVMAADIDEKAIRHEDPYKIPELLAHAKADALVPQAGDNALLLTGDVIAICNGHVLEKPTSREEIHQWAKLYEQHPAEIVSGVVVHNTKTGQRVSGTDISRVEWGPIDPAELDTIIDTTDIFNVAAFNEEMVEAFATYNDSHDRLRGVPLELVRKLIDDAS